MIFPTIKSTVLIHAQQNQVSAAGFFLKHNEEIYFLTAAHTFGNKIIDFNLPLENTKFINNPNSKVYILKDLDAIIIKNPNFYDSTKHHALNFSDKMKLGEDVLIYGYLYGDTSVGLPFIKKGCLSGVQNIRLNKNIIYLDLMNNQGFSGGPILNKENLVIGMVSGFLNDKKSNPNSSIVINSGITIGCWIMDILNSINQISLNPALNISVTQAKNDK